MPPIKINKCPTAAAARQNLDEVESWIVTTITSKRHFRKFEHLKF
jgi:hypothetical protein